jgi:GxxExxY protein
MNGISNMDSKDQIQDDRGSGLLFENETHTILQFCFQITNTLGHGFREKTYENALVHLLGRNNIPHLQQPRYPVIFDEVKIDEFIPDLIIYNNIIVDLKTIESITENEIGQMLNYLRVTKLKLALIINFKHARLQYRRVSL